jgi:hypothetical protein
MVNGNSLAVLYQDLGEGKKEERRKKPPVESFAGDFVSVK